MALHASLHGTVRAVVCADRRGVRRVYSFMVLTALGLGTLMPLPAMAMPTDQPSTPFAIAAPSNQSDRKAKADAKAEGARGRLESAVDELSGDPGHQVKGNAKQAQATAMEASENLKKGAKSVAKTIGKAATDLGGDRSWSSTCFRCDRLDKALHKRNQQKPPASAGGHDLIRLQPDQALIGSG